MIRRYIYPAIVLLLFLLMSGAFLVDTAYGSVDVNLERGGTRIEMDKVAGKVLTLNGEWLYKEGLHDPDQGTSGFAVMEMKNSSLWTSLKGHGPGPSNGSVTYHCELDTKGMEGMNAIRIPPIDSAYKLFVNGEVVALSGIVSDDIDGYAPGKNGQVFVFDQVSETLILDLQISNFYRYTGGFQQGSLEYGRYIDILHKQAQIDYRLLIYIMGLAIFALIFIVQSLYDRRDWYLFYIGLGTFFYSFLYYLRDAILVPTMIQNLGWNFLHRIEFVLFVSFLVLFLNHGRHFFNELTSVLTAVFAQIAGAILILLSIFLPMQYFPYLELVILISVVLVGIYLVSLGIRGIAVKRQYSLFFFLGVTLFLVVAFFDLLRILGYWSQPSMLWAAFLVYCSFALMVLAIQTGFLVNRIGGIQNELENAMHTKNSLLSRVSGEVGISMDKISDLTQSLVLGSLGPLTVEQMTSTSLIMSQSLHHQFLLNDILDYTSLQEEDLTLEMRNIKLFPLTSVSISSFQPALLGVDISITNNVDRDFPLLWGDHQRLGQIFYNLIGFGLQVLDEGSISIDAEDEEDRGKVLITITGATPRAWADALELVNPKRSQNLDENDELHVLRYQLTNRLLELHGSPLDISTEEDKFTFSYTLAHGNEMSEEEAQSEEMAVHLDALQNLQPLTEEVESERDISIHIVSADPVGLQVMKSQLATMNYRIVPLLKGQECLDKAALDTPQMVVIDANLVDMDGHALCRELRERYSPDTLPVIMVLGQTMGSDSMETLTAGANDYIRRPYQQEEFLTRVNTHLQLAKISSIYSQFVPKEFLKSLGQKNFADIKLGDQVQREMTILFVDIRAFTNLSENMTPQENFKFINSYLSQFTPIITRNNGFVDKFIGDAIMALYPDRPEDAIRTANEMLEYVKVYNGYRAKCGYKPINIGVGIHTGNLILGIIGDKERMQGTVISDSVNLAARIQDVTKLYKANVVISQETFRQLIDPAEFDLRFLGKVKVKGKANSVSLFEVFNSDNESLKILKKETSSDFEIAIMAFAKREFAEAEKLFQKVLQKNPEDQTAMLFLDRAQKFMTAEKKSFLTSL